MFIGNCLLLTQPLVPAGRTGKKSRSELYENREVAPPQSSSPVVYNGRHGCPSGYEMDTLSQAKELFLSALEQQNQGSLEHAESLYRKALELVPERPSVINNLAAVLLQLERYGEARSWCEKLLAMDPRNVTAILNFGNCQLALQSPEAALKSYDDALALDPHYVEALNSRGKALMELGRPAEALASCDQALLIKSDHVGAFMNRGAALVDLKRPTEALAAYERVLALQPNHAEAFNNRGEVLQQLARHGEALASYDRALALKPEFVGAFSNRGNALQNLRRYDEALASYSRALALRPDYREANLNEGLCRLLIGDFAQGWEKYEWRWHDGQGRIFPVPLWDGGYVDGVLLAWGEQGLGDQILHAGMLDEVRSRAKQLVVEVESRLVKLFVRSFPTINVITRPPNYDAIQPRAHTPMGSIGRYFRNDWKDFPVARAGYLVPEADRAVCLREKYAGDGRPLVGLSWLSKVDRIGEHKSARLREFEPILTLPGIKFVDLQYGDTREERNAVAGLTGADVVHVNGLDNYQDIDGLAALISACDAVVTVSNTTAHIAGALGKPTYVMLPYAQGNLWYWHSDRDYSPWYPAVRIFRQHAPGDWDGVMLRVAEELARSVKL